VRGLYITFTPQYVREVVITYEPETEAFLNAITISNDSTTYFGSTAYEILGSAIWSSLDACVVQIKTALGLTLGVNNLSTKFKFIYPRIGGTSTKHAYNLVTATQTGTYSGGWTHTSTGQSPNGINGYADTKYAIPAGTGFGSSEDLSFGIYLNNFNGTSGSFDLDIGTRIPDPDNTHIWWIGGEWSVTSSSRFAVENSSGSYTGTPSPSLYTICRIGSNIRMYKGNTLNTTTSYNGNDIGSSGSKFYLGCVSVGNTPQFFSRKKQCFVFISSGLDNTQAINLNTAINAYQTTLGRNTY